MVSLVPKNKKTTDLSSGKDWLQVYDVKPRSFIQIKLLGQTGGVKLSNPNNFR